MKLYSYLEALGPRALYSDTDSVIFTTKSGDLKPPLGDYLGDLTDKARNNYIETFETGGPKNHGYKLKTPYKDGNKTHCKVRGITLNCKNRLNVNFNVLKTFVKKRKDGSVSVQNAYKITRDRDNTALISKCEKKDYRHAFDKRVIREEYISYPFGY